MTPRRDDPAAGRSWTFLTNHAHVLLALAREPTARLRDVAVTVGVTERACQGIVADLEAGGYLKRERVGRRNQYTINQAGLFRHPAESGRRIGDLIALFHDHDHAEPEPAIGIAIEAAHSQVDPRPRLE